MNKRLYANIQKELIKTTGKYDNLIQEALKYKTPEEFVKAQNPISVPIESVIPTEGHTQEEMSKNKVRPEIAKDPIRVEFNKEMKLQIQDGNHRYFDALNRGDKTIQIVFSEDSVSLNFQGEFDRIRKFWNKAHSIE